MPRSWRGGRLRSAGAALSLAGLLVALAAPDAGAHAVLVTDGSRLTAIDSETGSLAGAPVQVGDGAGQVAITPDDRFAFVANTAAESVSAVDLRSEAAGPPIPVPGVPVGLALSPDGSVLYVVTRGADRLTMLDTTTHLPIGSPDQLCAQPAGIAISPDDRFAYIACQAKGQVWAIDTQSGEREGAPIAVGGTPLEVGFTPDGELAFVTDPVGHEVAVIDTAEREVERRVEAGEPTGLALAPSGRVGYFTEPAGGLGSFSTGAGTLGPAAALGSQLSGIAIGPDGGRLYAAESAAESVAVLSATTMQPVGPPVFLGAAPQNIAVAPNQPPHATFTVGDGHPLLPLAFDAGGSSDPDGSVARYEWSFGDGSELSSGPARPSHVYKRPGDYKVTLRLTDAEGCSTVVVFTGRTASCAGSPAATQTQAVQISYPAVRVRCPRSAGRRGCHVRLQALTGRHGRVETRITRATLHAGRRAALPLRTKPRFARRLDRTRRALVRLRLTVRGRTRTRFRHLRLVR